MHPFRIARFAATTASVAIAIACTTSPSETAGAGLEEKPDAKNALVTVRETKTGPAGCDKSETLASRAKAAEYLGEIMRAVMRANPDTFKGPLAPEKFCVAVVAGTERNANADSFTGLLRFEESVVDQAKTDAH